MLERVPLFLAYLLSGPRQIGSAYLSSRQSQDLRLLVGVELPQPLFQRG
jgi:hypothetical protein